MTRLHDEVYTRLRHGRLVLIGGPGVGKTGAMILLLIEALRHRERVPDAARTAVPVPVWLTLGSWDPRSQGLREWVTATIGLNHPYLRAQDSGPDAVAQLFDTGRIALFLDGLDEMPDTLRGEAIERLTAETAGRRVVITSRPEEFRGTLGTGRQLPYTAVVELRPVGSRAAARYLLESQVGVTRPAWQDVADRLLAHPDGVLARTLNTPLALSLARSAYAGGDPRELLTHELAGEQILRVHMRKVPVADDVKPALIARGTPGFSGADLANLVNEAALFAARANQRLVAMEQLEKAKDKIMMGAERRSMVMSPEEKRMTAYHEAGHAIIGLSVPEHDPVYKVTIIPRGRALGVTQFLPESDRYSMSKRRIESMICTLFGGRIASDYKDRFDARVADVLLAKAGVSNAAHRHIHVSVLKRAVREAAA